jgi:hypothetical protein
MRAHMTTLVVGSFLSFHVACSDDQTTSFHHEKDASSGDGSSNGGSSSGGSSNGGSSSGGTSMSSGGKGAAGISGSSGAGGANGVADAGDRDTGIADASVSDGDTGGDTGTASGGAGTGGGGSGGGGSGAGGKATGGSSSSTDAGDVDAGSACHQLGQCCTTVQPPALRPSCELYASADMQLQCAALVGFYCGGPPIPDAGSGGCTALATCCPSLGAQRASCEQVVSAGVAGACELFRNALCP